MLKLLLSIVVEAYRGRGLEGEGRVQRQDTGRTTPDSLTIMGGVLAVLALAGVGITSYLNSPAHQLHSPNHALQQLDLFYLNEPAPRVDQAGSAGGRTTLLVVCDSCEAPRVDAQVRVTSDPEVAAAYGLLTADGRLGPGYAIIDGNGAVRYRTFDPAPADHVEEIRVLLENTP